MKKYTLLTGIFMFVLGIAFFTKEVGQFAFPLFRFRLFSRNSVGTGHNAGRIFWHLQLCSLCTNECRNAAYNNFKVYSPKR